MGAEEREADEREPDDGEREAGEDERAEREGEWRFIVCCINHGARSRKGNFPSPRSCEKDSRKQGLAVRSCPLNPGQYHGAMPRFFKQLLLISLCFTLGACATARQSRWAATGTAFALGAAVGNASAPADERRELHSLYWGGLLGIATAVASEFFFSDQEELSRLRLEKEKLQAEMDLMQNANRVLVREGQGYFKNPGGEEYFQSGKAKWRVYQIDKWTKDGPNRLYHQDRMVELTPSGTQ